MIPSFQCIGSSSSSHIFRTNSYSFCFKVHHPFFINSGGILSEPAALLDFSLLIIVHISLCLFYTKNIVKIFFPFFNTCSICDITLFSESLQFVGNVAFWWSKYFTSKNFFVSFLLLASSNSIILLLNHSVFWFTYCICFLSPL